MTNKKKTELDALESFRLLFTNISKVKEIKMQMAEYGYDQKALEAGQEKYEIALNYYNKRQEEEAQKKQTYQIYLKEYKKVEEEFRKDRKRAKIALLDRKDLYPIFYLKKPIPDAHLQLLYDAKLLYEQIQTNPLAHELLSPFKLNKQGAVEKLKQIEIVNRLRGKYEKEKAESQQCTQNKNRAFKDIRQWVRKFYAVAQIALEDSPQLLESIGKFMRS